MRTALFFGLLAPVAAILAVAEPLHHIEITADVPSVEVARRQPGRVMMQLPNLTFAMNVTVECETNWRPDSVSISVADTRVTFAAEQLRPGRELTLELRIPSNQLSPLHVEHFCVATDHDEPATGDRNSMRISGVVSAQASLRCATDSKKSITYITKPLDILLECAGPEQAGN
jgi:hypothetical protein